MAERKVKRGGAIQAPAPETGEVGDHTRGQQGPTGADHGVYHGDDDVIRERAYRIWEGEGRPEGRASEHWLQAMRELGVAEVTPRETALDPGASGDIGERSAARTRVTSQK